MKWLYRRISRWFRKTEDRTLHKPADENTNLPTLQNKTDILGILIFTGHTSDIYGTRTYNKIKEQHSNAITAELLKDKWSDLHISNKVHLETAYRKYEKYSKHCRDSKKQIKAYAKRLGCSPKNILAIELHYNAASVRNARGGYFMIEKGDNRGLIAAKIIIDSFVLNTPMTLRKEYKGVKGVQGMSSGRGFGWIDYCNDDGAMSLLFEPFFCDYKNIETEWLFGKAVFNTSEKAQQMIKIADKMSDLWVSSLLLVIKEFNA